jgi:hypothetical protein
MTMKNTKAKARKYYSTDTKSSPATPASYKVFLVRYHDEDANRVENNGPYELREEADEALKSYLKQGICSWLVSYNG